MKKIVIRRLSILFFGLLLLSCTKKDDSPTTPEEGGPDITSFSPTSGPVGTEIFITGKNFGSTVTSNTVKIGNNTATVNSASITELFITVPNGAATGKVSVTVGGKTDTGGTFTVTQDEESTGIVLNKKQLTLFTLDSETLSIISGNDDNASITWGTNDENIAKVDDNGKITGISEGTTIITATVGDNNVAALVHVKPSVFAAGYEMKNGIEVVTIWKNGVATNLTDGTKFGAATSMFVDGLNIYVCGIESNQNDLPSARVWKNGEPIYTLSDASNYGVAHSIYVYDSDIYVAGSETDDDDIANATIWKNGVTYATLADGMGMDGSLGSGIFVNETGIYTAGYEEDPENINGTAKLWKNTTKENLTDGTKHSRAYAVHAIGTNIYTVGYEQLENEINVAKIWKNGEATDLSDGSRTAEANAIFVAGEDVYVAGGYYDDMENPAQAILWKNDTPTNLGMASSAASSVYVYGEDVYVGGYESNEGVAKAIVWKNQIPMNLTLNEGAGESAILSVFVR